MGGLTSWKVLALAFVSSASAGISGWASPEYKYIFQFPLPIPPIAEPLSSYTGPNGTIDYYEINILPFEKQTYPNLGTTSYVGYNGIAPGPTFHMTKGREAIVRFINKYDKPSSIHLHGSYSRTPFDGWAEDRTYPGEYKDYYYPNAQPMRTLWYHDHSLGITAVNAYFGQAGFYILNDPSSELELPSGDYDIPLMLASKQFLPSGKLLSPENERTSLYGDVNTVNGQPWPYLNVESRKYKFRLLDASISRTYKLYLVVDTAPTVRIPFTVVGADAGYLSNSVITTDIIIAMAERYEIVIDFDKYKNQNLTLMNERDFQTNPDYPATDRVIRFVVGDQVSDSKGNGNIPDTLVALNRPAEHPVIDNSFTFERQNGQWLINGVGFEDIPNRILAYPKAGKVQRWELINKSGGWSHPIHIHLIDFQVVKRTGGRGQVMPYEAAALKDVVYLGMNERVELIANFAPWAGVYMFHCHNLVHEDHDMMAAFNVTDIDLSSYGYPHDTTFIDPMTPAYQAKKMSSLPFAQGTPEYLADIPNSCIKKFYDLDAYPEGKLVEEALDDYYSKQATSTKTTTTAVTKGGGGGGGGTTTKTTLSTVIVSASATTSSAKTTSTSDSGKGKGKNGSG